jgi:hypothetical protein
MKTNFFYPLILAFLCITLLNSQAQFEGFDLSTYKNPDYKRQQLDLNVNMEGLKTIRDDAKLDLKEDSYSSYRGNLLLDYYKIVNSEKLQQEWGINLSENPSSSKEKYNYAGNSSHQFSTVGNAIGLTIQNSSRLYRKNLTFLEVGFYGSLSNYYSKTKNDYAWDYSSNNETNLKETYITGKLDLRIGKGRIEYIEDARLAIYILDDLNKHGRLSRTPTNEEILAFSKIITQLKNKRFFDTRLRKIEEITKVDSFMQANNLITKPDAAYFTTVTDNWDNASGPARTSGLRYSIGISPSYKYIRQYQHETTNDSSAVTYNNYDLKPYSLSLPIDAQIDYSKPLNLHWQLTGGFNLKYAFSNGKIGVNNDSKLNLNEISSNLFIKTGLYPNSRTYWESSFNITYENLSSDLTPTYQTEKIKGSYRSLFPQFSVLGYHYFSQQLQLKINYTISYVKPSVKDNFTYFDTYTFQNNKDFYQNFTITLTYMLF